MKLEMGITKPDVFTEEWPGQYNLFSWMEFVTAIPQPIFIITSLKENGKPNACLHAWSTFTGEGDRYYCIISILNHYHTYHNIRRNGEFCINFPDISLREKAFSTIQNNQEDTDEISASGFTIEKAHSVSAPRIKECFLSLECRLEWEKPVFENSKWVLFNSRIVHLSVEKERFVKGGSGLYGDTGYFYNINEPKNPIDGSGFDESIGVIKVVK